MRTRNFGRICLLLEKLFAPRCVSTTSPTPTPTFASETLPPATTCWRRLRLNYLVVVIIVIVKAYSANVVSIPVSAIGLFCFVTSNVIVTDLMHVNTSANA